MKEIPKMLVERVKVRKDEKMGVYYVYFELGDENHPYVLTRQIAESLIKNLNRL